MSLTMPGRPSNYDSRPFLGVLDQPHPIKRKWWEVLLFRPQRFWTYREIFNSTQEVIEEMTGITDRPRYVDPAWRPWHRK